MMIFLEETELVIQVQILDGVVFHLDSYHCQENEHGYPSAMSK